jgi:hypothetical protein
MGQAVERHRCHLGVTEYTCPLAEAEVYDDDDAGALVEFGEQVEEQRAV